MHSMEVLIIHFLSITIFLTIKGYFGNSFSFRFMTLNFRGISSLVYALKLFFALFKKKTCVNIESERKSVMIKFIAWCCRYVDVNISTCIKYLKCVFIRLNPSSQYEMNCAMALFANTCFVYKNVNFMWCGE